jgi:hypothetical protein
MLFPVPSTGSRFRSRREFSLGGAKARQADCRQRFLVFLSGPLSEPDLKDRGRQSMAKLLGDLEKPFRVGQSRPGD